MPTLQRFHLLDASSSGLSIDDSVRIPLAQLPNRTYELPPPPEVVLVADTGDEAAKAIHLLQSLGRTAEVVQDFLHGQSGNGRLWEPNAFLAEVLPHLFAGRALDVACGTGRDSVFLASAGGQVTGIDILPDAIEPAQRLEERYLQTQGIDWRAENIRSIDGTYDLIVQFYYLDRDLTKRLINALNPGGSLLIETFTETHRSVHGKPSNPDRVLRLGELEELAEGLEVRHFSEDWRRDRHTARLWAVKR